MKRLAEKAGDLVQPSLKIREELRQRLAHEAKKNQRSLNREMTLRLEQSLQADAMKTIEEITADLKGAWARVRKQMQAEAE